MNKEEIKKVRAAQKTRDKEFLDNTYEGMNKNKNDEQVLDTVKSILYDFEREYMAQKCFHEADTFIGACERLRRTSDVQLIRALRVRFYNVLKKTADKKPHLTCNSRGRSRGERL